MFSAVCFRGLFRRKRPETDVQRGVLGFDTEISPLLAFAFPCATDSNTLRRGFFSSW